MNGVPPTPATSVSAFVGVLMLLTGLIVVLALLVVRRQHRTPITLAVATVTLLVLAAGGLFLIVPPQVPVAQSSATLTPCPYDRLVWSNMRDDVDESWQPCRRVARIQLTMTLVGASVVTVMAAAMAVRKPRVETEADRGQVDAH